MAGRFDGLSDEQWEILEPLMPEEPPRRLKGKLHTPWIKVCNSIFWVMITGARWVDLPTGEKWASKSAAHRWLGVWQENGTLEKILSTLRELAFSEGLYPRNSKIGRRSSNRPEFIPDFAPQLLT